MELDLTLNLKEELQYKKNKNIDRTTEVIREGKMLLEKNEVDKQIIINNMGLNRDHDIKREKEINLDREHHEKTYGNDIYTFDEIKSFCIQYDLKILKTKYFLGDISSDFSQIVVDFAKNYKINIGIDGDWGGDVENFYILAPRNHFVSRFSFNKKKKTQSAILFYKICPGYFKSLYQWGNSFTILRYAKGWINKCSLNDSIHKISISFALLMILTGYWGYSLLGSLVFSIIIGIILTFIYVATKSNGEFDYYYYTENSFNKYDKCDE